MDFDRIDRYVTDLLELSAVGRDGDERNVYEALHHLLSAVSIFEQMTKDERDVMVALKKKLAYFFSPNFSLKERKETKKKKIIPPNPLLKEKEKKETETKHDTHTVGDADLEAFRKECEGYVGRYDMQMVVNFYNYYTMRGANGKMRFQNEPYWHTGKRLEGWANNSNTINDALAAERLKKQKQRQAKEATAAVDQQQQAAEREMADAQREAELEKSRENQMTTAEYINANPDGILAKIYREKHKNS